MSVNVSRTEELVHFALLRALTKRSVAITFAERAGEVEVLDAELGAKSVKFEVMEFLVPVKKDIMS